MRAGKVLVAALGLVLAGGGIVLAGADMEPVIVVPGRPGIPIVINGQDVSGAVIEGDWGLAHSQVGITIINPWPVYRWRPGLPAVRARGWRPRVAAVPVPGYFPRTGHRPAYGRLEVVPPANRPKPKPAPRFNQTWSSESAPLPPTIATPYAMPPVIIGPRSDPNAGRHGPRPVY